MKTKKISTVLAAALLAILATACAGENATPEEIAEAYIRENIKEIAEEAAGIVLKTSRNNDALAKALERGLQPFRCRPHRPDDLNADGDLRCNLTMATRAPVEIEIQVPVDIAIEWEHERGEKVASRAVDFRLQATLLWTSYEQEEGLTDWIEEAIQGTAREGTDPTPAQPIKLGSPVEYAECLDETYLRASRKYDAQYSLPAAVWYCRNLEPSADSYDLDNR